MPISMPNLSLSFHLGCEVCKLQLCLNGISEAFLALFWLISNPSCTANLNEEPSILLDHSMINSHFWYQSSTRVLDRVLEQ